jgi:hypothetical protein
MLVSLAALLFVQQSSTAAPVPVAVQSGGTAARIVPAIHSVIAPILDGRLDDPVWASATVASDFTQNYPHDGAPATERTEARVVFVGDAVYVGMRAFDNPDSLVAPLSRRDAMVNSDMLDVLIDSFHDRRSAFHFRVNPAGVKMDMYHYDDIQGDMSWDAVWDVAVARDSLGWTAEFRIPLSQLRYSDPVGKPTTWGINFYRNIGRRQEWSSWAPVPQNEGREVSRFGELTGLDFLTATRRREIIPYVSSSVTRSPGDPADPFFRRTALENSVGLDAKLGLRGGLTLDLTLHPDFGQVEADPSEVNLSGFETTQQERRPFFVENGGLFEMSIYESPGEVLFYPRRIGRSPEISADARGGFVSEPSQTTILGAAKISGKTSSGLSVGILEAVTRAAYADGRDSTGANFRELVEPATNYGVVRIQRDLREGKSAIGGMFTTANRLNLGATASELHSAAYAAGLDFRHRFGGSRGDSYELFGAIFASSVEGSADAIAETQRSSAHYFQRPDADHITYDTTRTSLTGLGARLQFSKATGRLRFGNAYYTRSPGFEVNDLGIQKEADWNEDFIWVGIVESRPGRVFNNWNIFANTWSWWTYGGERTFSQFNIDLTGELRNFWGSFLRVGRRLPAVTLRLRGGPLLTEDGAWVAFGNFYSPMQNVLRLNGSYSFYRSDSPGAWSVSWSPTVSWQPSSSATVSLGPSVSRERIDNFYVAQAGIGATPRYVVGAINHTTTALTTRLDLAFSPTLSLQLYAQPFLAAATYDDFKEVVAPRAAKYGDRYLRFVPRRSADSLQADVTGDGVADLRFADPAFNAKEFRSNAVLRWEYLPGSTVFAVWSQGRHADTDGAPFRFSRDAGDLFRTVPENVFLVKVTRWMNF